jgi:glycosyltransferase involved in cell wall biosynthesis
MRILLLNHYYPPDTSATAKMAATVVNALSERHDVTVLCGRPSYDSPERRPWRPWQTEIAGRARIIRVGSTDYSRFQMRRRVINYLTYVALATPRALFLRSDVVLAMTDPPFEGIVGAVVALLKGKPYVYNIRDLYPDMATGGEIVEPGLLSRVWEVLHRWALRHTTRVIVLGEDMRARIAAKGIDPKAIKVVRDGTDIFRSDALEPVLDNHVIQTIRADFRFVLLHAGNLGFYGAWETLVTAVSGLKEEGVCLVFVGEGAQRARIESLAKGTPNVRFLSFFPAGKIPSVLAAPDAHVITVRRGLEGVVVPSKMYGILAAGKPILAVAAEETDVASLGAKFGFAVSADPDRPDEVASAIRFLARDSGKVQSMGRAARAVAPDYDRVKELQKFVEIIEEAVNA